MFPMKYGHDVLWESRKDWTTLLVMTPENDALASCEEFGQANNLFSGGVVLGTCGRESDVGHKVPW